MTQNKKLPKKGLLILKNKIDIIDDPDEHDDLEYVMSDEEIERCVNEMLLQSDIPEPLNLDDFRKKKAENK